ncbi:MAG: hypothetical protein AVDCRST_MAG89-4830 [uncultured Gemmatimonadetes bacterium]|uniref:Uncharacterized protein n=1 Tax=uncultured Gemmatimonadota bacterium TaxID=203437 RepID=A0A6J4N3D1_9BACT|nr:MAG: hypothetical protein AVDCRST_MAG89-4830 [uncultured Gemmatimonadota bacterium]
MRTLTCTVLFVAASSCTHDSRGTERVPARLLLRNDTAQIALPSTVHRGQSFTVTVTTFAGGCRQQSAGTDVSVRGSVAVVPLWRRPSSRIGGTPDDAAAPCMHR